ncbi:hypothetical protein [Sinomonas sp. R1AF57]|uniref:hypothetical protein n=1 Tax=Sinomonas sp. R1AF57 TaxID=2020377 RepID=UPI000B602511|nr:hypothetical protein [Sinomonas sp. R1AF57]ASN51782.1 hypothetical protein CGQ25_06615 [Sinomonas sp. R1AF57]
MPEAVVTGNDAAAGGAGEPTTASLARWSLLPAAAGPVLGTVWWLAAPGGRLYGEGSNYRTWDERDLVFAALGALAGVVLAVLLSLSRRRPGLPARGLAALAGSVVGSALMWGTGLLLGRIGGARGVDPRLAESAFGLQSLSAIAVWPAIAALSVLALTTLWWVPPHRPGSHPAESPEDDDGSSGASGQGAAA